MTTDTTHMSRAEFNAAMRAKYPGPPPYKGEGGIGGYYARKNHDAKYWHGHWARAHEDDLPFRERAWLDDRMLEAGNTGD